jgi:hypothetical protein
MEHQNNFTLEKFEKKEFYGGAISCILPNRFMDMSELRQVPDYQEVHHDISTDQCFICEILSFDSEKDSQENALSHFKILSEDNDDQTGGTIYSHQSLDTKYLNDLGEGASAYIVYGNQKISKFKEQAKNSVDIYLVSLRIPSKETDILITYSVPVNINTWSSSFPVLDKLPNYQFAAENANFAQKVLEKAITSFEIKDWSLFG